MKFATVVLAIGLLPFSAATFGAEGHTISYGDHPHQSLSVYGPAERPARLLPVIVWVHGGGWQIGDKNGFASAAICRAWSASGAVCVALDYRLSPEVVHPAHVEDVAAGIAWVHRHISEHGGDPKRVFLLGHSAGAHLAALVATAPRYLEAHGLAPHECLAGVISIDTASYDLTATPMPLVRSLIADAFGRNPETLAAASPLLQARKNPQAVPPLVIAVPNERTAVLEESKALHAVLPKSELIVVDYPGDSPLVSHGLIALDLANMDSDLAKRLADFVRTGTLRRDLVAARPSRAADELRHY